MSGHSESHPGLQRHSLGDQYPWTVAVRGHGENQRCVPFNCLSGEWGPEFHVDLHEFKGAHWLAEKWIRGRMLEDAARELEAAL